MGVQNMKFGEMYQHLATSVCVEENSVKISTLTSFFLVILDAMENVIEHARGCGNTTRIKKSDSAACCYLILSPSSYCLVSLFLPNSGAGRSSAQVICDD